MFVVKSTRWRWCHRVLTFFAELENHFLSSMRHRLNTCVHICKSLIKWRSRLNKEQIIAPTSLPTGPAGPWRPFGPPSPLSPGGLGGPGFPEGPESPCRDTSTWHHRKSDGYWLMAFQLTLNKDFIHTIKVLKHICSSGLYESDNHWPDLLSVLGGPRFLSVQGDPDEAKPKRTISWQQKVLLLHKFM